MATRVRLERTVSRSGLHARLSTFLVVTRDCARATPRLLEKVPARPTYARGEAYEVVVEVPPGAFLVALDMRRNPRRRVRGDIVVYDHAGAVLLRAVYRKLKVRVVECRVDRALAHSIVKCVADSLKLPVKRYGFPGCKA